MARQAEEIFRGVFPAVTTQFDEQHNVDLTATQQVIDGLVHDGVHGLVLMGTVGENNSLRTEEKISLLEAAKDVVAGRVPILSGVSHFTTEEAQDYVRAAERIGIDGLMVLPAMVYVPDQAELEQHFRLVASATGLPIMLYNNPASYRVSISVETLERLADVDNIVCIKESAEDTRRFTDLINACGERFIVFAGLDDMAFEGLVLGAKGWVSGLTNAFPRESVALYELLQRGEIDKAQALYRWFMPLLHFDSKPKLVQYIKLVEQVMERGSERVRLPRMILSGAEREDLISTVREAEATRPDLDSLLG
ncbi:dihydrodipicolinate synthase family protein [Emcibacter nanhaiensis]|uniref:Dihydrodipicolinate synthase family protein n=1 Tax=Emcibacter nanhaiensis TaxID=1505037 RepID=A0A501PPL3_9PROT|nr:dihydrodipicolinate synthase family protein [Emcibacter nanhaiensis]TPD61736.1 dihydrodipicolinate synthase family protein [Emcibacter nanhaiensis]